MKRFLSLFIYLSLSSLALAQARKPTDAPKLPVIDHEACGTPVGPPLLQQAAHQEQMYSSFQTKRRPVGVLHLGDSYTPIGGVNIIREPDVAVVTNQVSEADVKPGETVLGYGYDYDGDTNVVAHGGWFREDDERVFEGSTCGFADKTLCTIKITKPGIKEWWVEIETHGRKAWVLGAKFNHGKYWYSGFADQMCRD